MTGYGITDNLCKSVSKTSRRVVVAGFALHSMLDCHLLVCVSAWFWFLALVMLQRFVSQSAALPLQFHAL